jgi:hypothetical protein
MAREIKVGDYIVSDELQSRLRADMVDAGGITWHTGVRETHEDVARYGQYWRHEDGTEIGAGAMKLSLGPSRQADIDTLTRALFDTDAEVIAFCSRVGERETRKTNADGSVTFSVNLGAYQRALDVAWSRDENGWATRAKQRCEAILAWEAAREVAK